MSVQPDPRRALFLSAPTWHTVRIARGAPSVGDEVGRALRRLCHGATVLRSPLIRHTREVDHRDQDCGAVMPVAAVVDQFTGGTVRRVGRPGDFSALVRRTHHDREIVLRADTLDPILAPISPSNEPNHLGGTMSGHGARRQRRWPWAICVLPVCAGLRLVVRRHGRAGRRRLEHPPDRIGGWIGHLSAASRPHIHLLPTPTASAEGRWTGTEGDEGAEMGAEGQQPGEQPPTENRAPTYEEVFGLDSISTREVFPTRPKTRDGRATKARRWRPGERRRAIVGGAAAGGGRRSHLRRGCSGSPTPTSTKGSIRSRPSTPMASPRSTSGGYARSSRPGPRRPRSGSSSGRPSSTRPRPPRIQSDRRAGDAGPGGDRGSPIRRSATRRIVSEGAMFGSAGGRGRRWLWAILSFLSPWASPYPRSWCTPNGAAPSTTWSSGRATRRSL